MSELIATLHRTEQRLEVLTGGEINTVMDGQGRTFLLRRAQEQFRHSEVAAKAAILNVLPASIAVLDIQGIITSVNDAWRQFAAANALRPPGDGVGLNYLEICDTARGDDASVAREVGAGIRAVLGGAAQTFSPEYSCNSPTESRWFRLTVTPLTPDHRSGVVIMHLNVTPRRVSVNSGWAPPPCLQRTDRTASKPQVSPNVNMSDPDK